MKQIVLFGAGKSATVLIDYLKDLATEKKWRVTVADHDFESANLKVGKHTLVKAVELDIENPEARKNLVKKGDVIISLLPPNLHYFIALDCLEFEKHLLTASYIDDRIKLLRNQVIEKKLLFLCEMGLDPGIDHMSAMQLIHRIKALGGTIQSFKSHCGGLVAPESDDNPWHYKVSWNPRNIVLAGKSGAVFMEDGVQKRVEYEDLFCTGEYVELQGQVILSSYPNRDSLSYIPVYNLEEANTFVRTTLRHPDFCFGWKNIIDLKLTNETVEYNTDGLTVSDFFKQHFDKHGFSEWLNEMLSTRLTYAKDLMENLMKMIEGEKELEDGDEEMDDSIMLVNEKGELDSVEVEDVKDKAASQVALKMHEANLSLKQLFFLGLDSDQLINKGMCSAADVLQFIIETKLALAPHDKDMIVMIHDIDYEIDNIPSKVRSSLVVMGDDNVRTAMAKTVGLPLGVAARLILEDKLLLRGLHIPTAAAIYGPVLEELERFGIIFQESIE